MRKIISSILIVGSLSVTQASPSVQRSDLNQIFSKNISGNSLINPLAKYEMETTKGQLWGFWIFSSKNSFSNPSYPYNFYCQNYNGNSFCF